MQACYKQRFGKDRPTLSFDWIYTTERSASASRRQINLSVHIEYQCKIYLIFYFDNLRNTRKLQEKYQYFLPTNYFRFIWFKFKDIKTPIETPI